MKKFTFLSIANSVLLASVLFACFACHKDLSPSGVTFKEETVYQSCVQEKLLELVISPGDASYDGVDWAIEDKSILYLKNYSQEHSRNLTQITSVPLVKCGSTNVTATVNGITATCRVWISTASFTTRNLSLLVGDATALEVDTTPDGIRDLVTGWQSSDPSVASVDSKGNIKALKKGTTTITASFLELPLEMQVTVSDAALNFSSAYATPTTCTIGCTFRASGTVSDRGLCWTTQDRPAQLTDEHVSIGAGTNDFEVTATGLSEFTTYRMSLYYIIDGNVFYGSDSEILTPKERWRYDDEYGVTWYGVKLNGIVWAPMSCGYKAPDADGKGYPYGKLYQMGRAVGNGRGEAVWNDPADHTKGGYFIDEAGKKVELIYGQCEPDKVNEPDKFYFNDTPFMFTTPEPEPTGEEKKTFWALYGPTDKTNIAMIFRTTVDEGQLRVLPTNPCPKGWVVVEPQEWDFLESLHVHHFGERILLTENEDYEKHPQGMWFDVTKAGYRSPDGEIHDLAKDGTYMKIWPDYVSFSIYPWELVGVKDRYKYFRHCTMTADGPVYYKTFNAASAMSVRCNREI